MEIKLPETTGFFLWYLFDISYLNVGVVQINADPKKHIDYLINNPKPTHYVYQINEFGYTLSMYHQAHDHLPPMDENHRPKVDGWIPFDLRWIHHYRAFEIEPIIPKAVPLWKDKAE